MSVEEQQIATVVDALLSFVSKAKQSKDLFGSTEDFFVLFSSKSIPSGSHSKFMRILLPHSIYLESAEVCLIIPDENFELEVMKRERRLPPQLVETISIPQLKAKYNTFENKRMLASKYKLFLCEDRVSNVLAPILGSAFLKARKCPQKVRINTNFASNFNTCLKIARVYTGTGTLSSTKVAAVGQEKSHIVANILATVKFLLEEYSSAPDLLQSILVKTTTSPALRIFTHPESVPMSLPIEETPEKYLAQQFLNGERFFSLSSLTAKELINSFDPEKPLQMNIFGKKMFEKSKRVVQIILKKFKTPFTIISVETPAIPVLEFTSTTLMQASNPTKLLKILNVNPRTSNNPDALCHLDKPKKVKRSKVKKSLTESEGLVDSQVDSMETDAVPSAKSSKVAPKKKTVVKKAKPVSNASSSTLGQLFPAFTHTIQDTTDSVLSNPKKGATSKKIVHPATSDKQVGASAKKAQTSTVVPAGPSTPKKRGRKASEDAKQNSVENNVNVDAVSEVAPIRVTRSHVSKASENSTETLKSASPAKKAKVVASTSEKAKKSPAANVSSSSTRRVTRSKSSL